MLALGDARAVAVRAALAGDGADAATARARPLDADGQERLLEAHPAATRARGAGIDASARRRPAASTALAALQPIEHELLRGAARGLLEGDLERLLDGAPLRAAQAERAEDVLEQAGNESDFDKRLAMIQKAERKVLEDVPLIPISTNGYLIVRDPKVKLGFEVKSGYAFWRLDKAVIA